MVVVKQWHFQNQESIVKTVKIIVIGKVQGVYYRQSTKQKARELNINGTVRNLANGNVEIFAEGELNDIKQFIDWCNHGPSQASVAHLETEEISPKKFSTFIIIR